jgi:Fructose-bisphosphate aldolase class-I
MMKRSTRRVPVARGSPSFFRARVCCAVSRSIPARSPSPTLRENVTEGLDDLRDRLAKYRAMGARFAKWRAVFQVTDALPRSAGVSANASALARYAALCQEQGLVPIVEPEVVIDGSHTIKSCIARPAPAPARRGSGPGARRLAWAGRDADGWSACAQPLLQSNEAASLGGYSDEVNRAPSVAVDRRDWRDD